MFVPSKLFDGLACGKPVLLSVDGEAREILEESGGGLFVPPGDADALAATIRHLLRHPEIRKEMGERGRSFVTRHYRRRDQAQRFTEVVVAAADARAGRR
jgi:glycosyltransferase involved in cell wall biosynthesis